jgi:hypothetical protein
MSGVLQGFAIIIFGVWPIGIGLGVATDRAAARRASAPVLFIVSCGGALVGTALILLALFALGWIQ